MVNRGSDGINFLERVSLYGLLAVISGRGGAELLRLAIGMPIVEKMAGITLEEALAVYQQQAEEAKRQQYLEQIRAAIDFTEHTL